MSDASSAKPSRSASPPKRILLIRPTALGDVCRTVPVLASVRRAFPDSRIDWLVAEAFADAVRHHPALNGVVAFPRKRFARVWFDPRVSIEVARWAADLKRARYDLVIDLQGLFRSGLFAFLTRAPRRIGDANAREFARFGYNEVHAIDPNLHTVGHMLALTQAAGIEPVEDLRLYSGADDRDWRSYYLQQHGGEDEPYAVLAPLTRWPCKSWPMDRFTRLAQRLLDDDQTRQKVRRVIVLAAPDERAQMQPMIDSLRDEPRVLFPKTTVGQFLALIESSQLVVCNDSAALHVAVGFGRPIAAIFGPTDPARVGPYQREETIIQPPNIGAEDMRRYRRQRNDQTLIARIDEAAVWRKIIEQLSTIQTTG